MFFMDNQLYASRPFFAASYLKDSSCSNYALFMLSVVPLKTFFRSEKTPSLALTRGFGNVFLKKNKITPSAGLRTPYSHAGLGGGRAKNSELVVGSLL